VTIRHEGTHLTGLLSLILPLVAGCVSVPDESLADPPDCPAYVKEPTPPWAAPFLGRFGIPDPWPKDEGPLATNCAGIDRWQANHFIGYNATTASHLYGDYTPLRVPPVPRGRFPRCEKIVAETTAGLATDREKALALLTRAMPAHCLHPTIPPLGGPCPADRNLDEDGLLASGTAWCNEQARVFTRLCQLAGIPARLVFLTYSDAKSGHVISEFYADGCWCMADSSWNIVFPAEDGHLMSAAECHADARGRALAGKAYLQRIGDVFRLPDETLAGKDVPPGPDRGKALAARVAALRAYFHKPAPYYGDLWAFGLLNNPMPTAGDAGRPRLLVLTDIGGDPDDRQSLVRLLVHANEFEIEGFVASASGTPGELKQEITRPDLVRETVEAYRKVLPNLRKHDHGYPDAATLLARVRSGNPKRGWEQVGEGRDSEGSRFIIEAVARPEPGTLHIAIWGGQTDLAQALWRVRADRGEAGLRAFVRRFRVYDIDDQDRIAEKLWAEFPGLDYILAKAAKGRDRREGMYRGMYLGGDPALTSLAWLDAHVRSGHGPLGALYPPKTWTDPNPNGALKEGDSPSWLYLLPVGLGDPVHPDWVSWGGRFVKSPEGPWRDAPEGRDAVARWRPAFQNEFLARMDWCVKGPPDANHPPAVVLNGDASRRVIEIEAKAGDTVRLSPSGSSDPDGHALAFRWWVDRESGSYAGKAEFTGTGADATLSVPADAAGKEIHVVLEATDAGDPPLTRYRRAVVRAR
jgi:hypothetical protein